MATTSKQAVLGYNNSLEILMNIVSGIDRKLCCATCDDAFVAGSERGWVAEFHPQYPAWLSQCFNALRSGPHMYESMIHPPGWSGQDKCYPAKWVQSSYDNV